jgi:hypothetical protein
MQPIATPVQPVPQAPMSPIGAGSAGPSSMQERGRPVSEQVAWNTLTDEQKAQVDNLPPEAQAAFITQMMSNFGAAATDAQTDMTRADALRQGAPTSGGYAGGVYVGSSPLEHIAQVVNNKKREGEYDTALGERAKAREDDTAKRTMLGEQMFSRSDALRGMF